MKIETKFDIGEKVKFNQEKEWFALITSIVIYPGTLPIYNCHSIVDGENKIFEMFEFQLEKITE